VIKKLYISLLDSVYRQGDSPVCDRGFLNSLLLQYADVNEIVFVHKQYAKHGDDFSVNLREIVRGSAGSSANMSLSVVQAELRRFISTIRSALSIRFLSLPASQIAIVKKLFYYQKQYVMKTSFFPASSQIKLTDDYLNEKNSAYVCTKFTHFDGIDDNNKVYCYPGSLHKYSTINAKKMPVGERLYKRSVTVVSDIDYTFLQRMIYDFTDKKKSVLNRNIYGLLMMLRIKYNKVIITPLTARFGSQLLLKDRPNLNLDKSDRRISSVKSLMDKLGRSIMSVRGLCGIELQYDHANRDFYHTRTINYFSPSIDMRKRYNPKAWVLIKRMLKDKIESDHIILIDDNLIELAPWKSQDSLRQLYSQVVKEVMHYAAQLTPSAAFQQADYTSYTKKVDEVDRLLQQRGVFFQQQRDLTSTIALIASAQYRSLDQLITALFNDISLLNKQFNHCFFQLVQRVLMNKRKSLALVVSKSVTQSQPSLCKMVNTLFVNKSVLRTPATSLAAGSGKSGGSKRSLPIKPSLLNKKSRLG
jgi:hypothetical protein